MPLPGRRVLKIFWASVWSTSRFRGGLWLLKDFQHHAELSLQIAQTTVNLGGMDSEFFTGVIQLVYHLLKIVSAGAQAPPKRDSGVRLQSVIWSR